MLMRSFGLALLLVASCQSLSSSDSGVCRRQTLAEFCEQEGCPSSAADAQSQLCSTGVSRRVAHNDCGGDTVESGVGLVGSIYHFDATDQLVGAETWTDVAPEPSQCFAGQYGSECHVTAALVVQACSHDGSPADAGVM